MISADDYEFMFMEYRLADAIDPPDGRGWYLVSFQIDPTGLTTVIVLWARKRDSE